MNFAALGQRLREAREAKELTPDDVERATRIRARFIEAIERGDFSEMTPVQAQGFLRNYARFLGLDLDLLESELTGQEPKSRLGRRRREPDGAARASAVEPIPGPRAGATPVPGPAKRAEARPRRRRGWLTNTAIVLVAGAIVVVFVLGLTALLNRFSESAEGEAVGLGDLTAAPDDAVEVQAPAGEGEQAVDLAADASPTPAEMPDGPVTPELAYTPPGNTNTNVVVSVVVKQRTWLRVTVDGEVTRQGLARPGEVWQFEGTQSVGLRASNAAALELTVNNQRQGVLGARGQLFDQTFTREGLTGPPMEEPPTSSLAPDTLSAHVSSATAIASPEQATLILTPTLDLSATLPAGLEAKLLAPLASLTPAPDTSTPTATATPTLPPAPTDTGTPAPTSTRRPTATPLPTNTPLPTAMPTATPTPTQSPTPSRTPTPSWTPSPTISPTATFTPSPTPFLPPRLTRTPTASPK